MKKRNKPVIKKWGSNRIDQCDHNIIEHNGIIYCTICGRNFNRNKLIDEGYYQMFELEDLQ